MATIKFLLDTEPWVPEVMNGRVIWGASAGE
jgi:hypothetical protein